MSGLRFEWDESKSRSNRRKHGLSFEDAALVFRDPFHVSVQDRIVDGEERWQTFGLVSNVLLAMVAHTVLDAEGRTIVRIISARSASRREKQIYENENR